MTDPDRLAKIKEYRRAYPNSPRPLSPEDIDWLVGETERLRELFGPGDYQRVWDEVIAERERLRDLLAHLEWSGEYEGEPACPTCRHHQDEGHDSAAGCWLADELQRRDAPDSPPPAEEHVYRDAEGRKLYCPQCGANAPEGYPYEVLHDGRPDPDD
jgi:hypothetical protein